VLQCERAGERTCFGHVDDTVETATFQRTEHVHLSRIHLTAVPEVVPVVGEGASNVPVDDRLCLQNYLDFRRRSPVVVLARASVAYRRHDRRQATGHQQADHQRRRDDRHRRRNNGSGTSRPALPPIRSPCPRSVVVATPDPRCHTMCRTTVTTTGYVWNSRCLHTQLSTVRTTCSLGTKLKVEHSGNPMLYSNAAVAAHVTLSHIASAAAAAASRCSIAAARRFVSSVIDSSDLTPLRFIAAYHCVARPTRYR